MKASEYSKPVPAQGFLARLFGKQEMSCALNIAMGPESVEDVEDELQAAAEAISDWCDRHQNKDMILFTVFGDAAVCQAIKTRLPEICRASEGLSARLQGIAAELSLNGQETVKI